jgi:hypothetical protein
MAQVVRQQSREWVHALSAAFARLTASGREHPAMLRGLDKAG